MSRKAFTPTKRQRRDPEAFKREADRRKRLHAIRMQRHWPRALNFMPQAWREQASEAAGRVIFGDEGYSVKGGIDGAHRVDRVSRQGKRTRMRINQKRGHRNAS